jgi:hypothetical protein
VVAAATTTAPAITPPKTTSDTITNEVNEKYQLRALTRKAMNTKMQAEGPSSYTI